MVSPTLTTTKLSPTPAEIISSDEDISAEEEDTTRAGGKEREKEEKNFLEENPAQYQQKKRKRNISAEIISEAVHTASREATERMQSFINIKKEDSKTVAAVKILNDEYYSKWDTEKLLKAYTLMENKTKAEIFLCIRKELRDNWLEKEIAK